MSSPSGKSVDRAELRALIADVLDLEQTMIADDTHFINDLGVDSLLSLEVLVALERRYKVTLSENDLREMSSLSQAAALLARRLDGRH